MTTRVDLSGLILVEDWKPTKAEDVRIVTGIMQEPKQTMFIGIDPGVNFGISMILGKQVFICHGKLPVRHHPWEHGVDAYDFIQRHIAQHLDGGCLSVVEGAAYDKIHGQVGLESVRFAFYLGLCHKNANPQVVAIKTIRASVLGSGKLGAWERWPLLNHNAADSLGCALMAYSLGE